MRRRGPETTFATRDGRVLTLRPRQREVLSYLAQRPGRLVTYRELVKEVWHCTALSRTVIRGHIHELRRVLGREAIETVVGLGYRYRGKARGADAPARPGSVATPEHGKGVDYPKRSPR